MSNKQIEYEPFMTVLFMDVTHPLLHFFYGCPTRIIIPTKGKDIFYNVDNSNCFYQ